MKRRGMTKKLFELNHTRRLFILSKASYAFRHTHTCENNIMTTKEGEMGKGTLSNFARINFCSIYYDENY